MGFSNKRTNKTNFDKFDLDKKMEQFIDVGRQFVDGVSGTRPGQRKPSNLREFSRRNAKNVRNWVNDRVDSFFEDEYVDDWEREENSENFESFNRNDKSSHYSTKFIKRPLEAVSLREHEEIGKSEIKKLPYSQDNINEEWPEDSDFQVSRWKRPNLGNRQISEEKQFNNLNVKTRNFPKSRRSRT